MWDKMMAWGFLRESRKQQKETQQVVDMMADDVDPEAITNENAYKTRWIWYHTILAIGIFMTNMLLLAILLLLAIKL